ncbi:MAG TPA: hypothetical protein VFO10_14210 [Oligoflexus sp.]|uniref:hypothetical protein n=1 Tax=Oligoflexus sp. TaxID=1971216 RepID=UPI002D805BB8|nr:hypothetical protein [Oligoflexus sp.]HET9238411.1 hypothetical protein [Oligoflexus sp.]
MIELVSMDRRRGKLAPAVKAAKESAQPKAAGCLAKDPGEGFESFALQDGQARAEAETSNRESIKSADRQSL